MIVKAQAPSADVLDMDERERANSDDLIREANSRFRASRLENEPSLGEPGQGPAPDEAEVRLESPSVPQHEQPDRLRSVEPDPADSPLNIKRKSRLGVSTRSLRWALSLLVFGGWFLFTTLDDANRGDSGEIVGGGDLNVMALQIGDCFNDSDALEDVVYDVAAVPCSEAHDNEVFGVESLAAHFPQEEFPGQDPLLEHSYAVCSGELFDAYVGTPYLDSSLEVFSLTPSEESWDQGDREFVCALYRVDGGRLTGTARDSSL